MKTYLIKLLVLLGVVGSLYACKKSESVKECPLQTYHIDCTTREYNWVDASFDTWTNHETLQANCPEDVQKMAESMSYGDEQEYKHCHVVL